MSWKDTDWRDKLRDCDNPYLGPAIALIILMFLWVIYVVALLMWGMSP